MSKQLTNQTSKEFNQKLEDVINYNKVKENLIQYGRFLEQRKLENNEVTYEHYLVCGGIDFEKENIKLEIELFLAYSKEELDSGLAITNKDTDTLIALSESFSWSGTDDGIYIWDSENSIEIKITNNTIIKEINNNSADELIIDNKFILGYL